MAGLAAQPANRPIRIGPVKIGTVRRLTASHPYFADWDVDRYRSVEPYCQLVEAGSTSVLMEQGAMDPYAYFLVEGQVRLEDGADGARVIRCGDLDAGFPIAHLRPSRYRVRLEAGSRLLRIEGSRLRAIRTARRSARFLVQDSSVGGTWRSHPLVSTLIRQMQDGKLSLPSMPGIAMKIRRALGRESTGMAAIAAIVSADPGIAARLLRVANSSAFGGRGACETVQAALVRLGIERAQNMVLVLSTRDLFKTDAGFLRDRVMRRWRHVIDIAALAAVLGRLTPGLDGDRAMLVGLLHEIGALPILRLAEQFPDLADNPLVLDEVLSALTPEVSAAALAQWGMDEAFRDAALNQNRWFRDHDGGPDYTDVLVVAHLHLMVRERDFHRLPRIDETPAFGKLALGQLSPQLSLKVLDEARGQIQELKSLLS